MTEEEYRSDVLASAASRAETSACSLREGFVEEVLDRLRDAGEVPDFELCPEIVAGPMKNPEPFLSLDVLVLGQETVRKVAQFG